MDGRHPMLDLALNLTTSMYPLASNDQDEMSMMMNDSQS